MYQHLHGITQENQLNHFRIPETRKSSVFLRLSVLTIAIICPYAIGITMPLWLELSIFGFFVIITGIPHGAIDHIVAAKVYRLENTLTDKIKFYGGYLISMFLLGIVWIVSPITGFIIFLATSIYHFGQGDLAYITATQKRFTEKEILLFVTRGVMLLAMPILIHSDITAPIIESATSGAISSQNSIFEHGQYIAILAFLLHIALFIVFIPPWRNAIYRRELYLIILLGVLFFVAHPLVSFAVYFGVWHGLNHFFELRDFLQDSETEIKFANLYRQTVPFTILSFSGLAVLWLIHGAIGLQNQMISLLFILISVLTLPHMLLIDRMYRNTKPVD
jgi:Brp/Blh family beta-carotene 15,15'-monooxygenase